MNIMNQLDLSFFFFFKQKTAYEIGQWLEFRRVLFRSAPRDTARLTDRVLTDHERQPVRVRLDDDPLGLPAGDRLLARVSEERREGRDLRPHPDGVGALSNRRDDDRDGDHDDDQRNEELEKREAARCYCCALWSHDVMSALSPSPPGWPSEPSDQRS